MTGRDVFDIQDGGGADGKNGTAPAVPQQLIEPVKSSAAAAKHGCNLRVEELIHANNDWLREPDAAMCEGVDPPQPSLPIGEHPRRKGERDPGGFVHIDGICNLIVTDFTIAPYLCRDGGGRRRVCKNCNRSIGGHEPGCPSDKFCYVERWP